MISKILKTLILSFLFSNTTSIFAAADDGDYSDNTDWNLSFDFFEYEGEGEGEGEGEFTSQIPSVHIVRVSAPTDSGVPGSQVTLKKREMTDEQKQENIHKQLLVAFQDAALHGDANRMREIIDQIEDQRYYTLILRIIARFDRFEVIEDLFNNDGYSVNIEATDGHKNTAIHYAAHFNAIHVLVFLLQRGANMFIPNELGNTPLHIAAASGHLAIIQELVERGAIITRKNHDGDTALDLAIRNGHSKVKKYLLKRLPLLEGLHKSIMSAFSFSS